MISLGEEPRSRTISLQILKINEHCYLIDHPEFEAQKNDLRKSSAPFLKGFEFENPNGVCATLCLISTCESGANARPGILWICNDKTQKRRIEQRLETIGEAFLRGVSYHKVEIRDPPYATRLACSGISIPSKPGALAGRLVKSNLSPTPTTTCGSLCTLETLVDGKLYTSTSTLGGVIRVGSNLFAMTTAHAWLDKPKMDQISSASTQGIQVPRAIMLYC